MLCIIFYYHTWHKILNIYRVHEFEVADGILDCTLAVGSININKMVMLFFSIVLLRSKKLVQYKCPMLCNSFLFLSVNALLFNTDQVFK